ncbi:MAG: GNAT family N-acetyltransferase [Sphaerochaetaceae bacterium]|jgi:ribosomal protein S18 acetylase RimI-like enzyme|nr:GNAT family N-acetyltransferase [Sphaerochaetaceae bacterium]MDD4763683.1 GNAT family N-acetyltransferase [Sphaerochaetaceae bacterium]MDD4841703.1 GNAT family N-acetyltransferase [Sphaerochaetaceae bacterium]MDX9934583.1 GNAT family N-acetyltransferase [Sphaerochaetaceae bacterium]NLO60654.1 GNAT family N-acetyltransferase [Spirochaetales bacterium]
MEQIILRRCDVSDVEVLRKLSEITFRETFGADNTPADMECYVKEHFSVSRMKEELGNFHSLFFLAVHDGKAVAYMKLNFSEAQTEPDYPNSLELQRIYVLHDFKHNNIGRLLMEKAIEVCRREQLGYLWLGVWEHNAAAIRFYEKQGFKMCRTHQFTLGTDVQTDYIMKCFV